MGHFDWKVSLGDIIMLLTVGLPMLAIFFKTFWTLSEHVPHSHLGKDGLKLRKIGDNDIITYPVRK